MLAKAAHGLADDLLTNTLLTARCPVVLAPAMHTEMWEHPATRANVATLRERGVLVVEPAEGRLTGADTGKGRLPEPAEIFEVCREVLAPRRRRCRADLAGRRVVVSAGGTREPLDPVRFLGNRSSGLQGYALARAAAARGAEVTLVAANAALPDPAGVDVVRVETTAELRDAGAGGRRRRRRRGDGRGARRLPPRRGQRAQDQEGRRRLGADASSWCRTPTSCASSAPRARRPGSVVVGFAAETGDATGRCSTTPGAKLARKGCDLLVVNDVSGGAVFGSPTTRRCSSAPTAPAPTCPAAPRPPWPTSFGTKCAARLQD